MDSTRRFLAVVADLVASREAPDRAALQDRLRKAVRSWRGTSLPAVASGPEITAGDEVQLLLGIPKAGRSASELALAFLADLSEALRPARVVAGLGVGPLSTALRDRVGENDGPCFHHAREALDAAKREGRIAVVRGLDEAPQDAVNALLRLAGDLRRDWTDRQREVVALLQTAEYRKDVARKLGVSPSVVTEVLGAARYDAINEAERAASALLAHELGAPKGTS
jgi:hypothetical protein